MKPAKLAKAMANGGTELYLQPIVELPSREIRYFEAFARLRVGDNILTAKQFLPAAKNNSQIAEIDFRSLELTIKIIRKLQREGNDFPIFWNIAAQTLANEDYFNDILEKLRANQPLNDCLICEISHAAYERFNHLQHTNLARIRDLGFEFSIDRLNPALGNGASVSHIVESGIFKFFKVPVLELMRISQDDVLNFASQIAPVLGDRNIVLIASEVENQSQTISMIDSDVFLAQGDALMPAKALKKELGKA